MTSLALSLEEVPLSPFHTLLTWPSGGGSFVDGYVLSIIGVALAHISSALAMTTLWEGLTAASALIGIFFGGSLGGWLTDRLGRRRLFFAGQVLFVPASAAQFWADSALSILLLRLVIGIVFWTCCLIPLPISLYTLGIAQTMYSAALITLIGLLLSWLLAPETRSLNLQQAAALG